LTSPDGRPRIDPPCKPAFLTAVSARCGTPVRAGRAGPANWRSWPRYRPGVERRFGLGGPAPQTGVPDRGIGQAWNAGSGWAGRPRKPAFLTAVSAR